METIYRNVDSLDWITLIIFISLILLALGKYLFKGMFSNFIILPFNNKYVTLYNKKGKLFNWFHLLLTFFQLINFSLFIFLAKNSLSSQKIDSYPIFFFLVLGILIIYLLVKIGIQMANGFVFNANELVTGLIFNKISYFNYSSCIAFLANIILTYILKDSKPVVYLSIFCILFINGIGLVNALRNHQKLISINIFYFILYLCALEIAPLVLIGSYLND
ncbi:DUF4271 domain-containing protein [uncultured Croceitalea sp.]|uniref:DUF4271 domain-containing protein n=1 Tax=uncultured Croceitalea sp. TaxID=1798908 RepID=UPI003305D5FF